MGGVVSPYSQSRRKPVTLRPGYLRCQGDEVVRARRLASIALGPGPLHARTRGCRPSGAARTERAPQLPQGTVESLLAEPDKLTQVLTYHVVPGRVTAADVVGLTKAPTVQGEELSVSVDGSIHVDGARVTSADIEASNGLIHVIDRVLLPAAT